ncbi:dik [Drosophila busckii]|uniref:Dik n=2 Tax=Drosophila busckii TaxID=30019 RepID=A0A0M3QZS1_DROBS|nr:dik [Drosophila busckii]
MSTNLKNIKMAHFGGGGSSLGYTMSAGKLLSHSSSSSSSTITLGSTLLGGSAAAAAAVLSHKAEVGVLEGMAMPSGTPIPLIRRREMPKTLPAIAAALQRPADEHLAAENLDAVQLELEQMLSNVALRARVLKAEYDSLDRDERRQDRRRYDRLPQSSPPMQTSLLNGLLGLGSSSNSNGGPYGLSLSGIGSPAGGKRKMRDDPTVVRKKHSAVTITKAQMAQKHLAKHSPLTDDSMDYLTLPTLQITQPPPQPAQHTVQAPPQLPPQPKLALPKNDMPNKFWLSVEPYCMPLTNEDLRLLDDLLEQYRGPLVPPLPVLGPHYATQWAQEDMKSLQPGNGRQKSQASQNMLKKADQLLDKNITGPLTQRLVSALLEESLPSEQAAVAEQSSSSNSNSHSHSAEHGSSSSKDKYGALNMLKHGVGIEQRLKRELLDSGILLSNELNPHDQDIDEVLLEIKRVTSEIGSVAQFNAEELKRLRAAANEEIKRIEVKRKLDTIDQEILECYKRNLQYRSKRKAHTLEEKQEILRLTNEQRSLSEQLEQMQVLTLASSSSSIGFSDGKL